MNSAVYVDFLVTLLDNHCFRQETWTPAQDPLHKQGEIKGSSSVSSLRQNLHVPEHLEKRLDILLFLLVRMVYWSFLPSQITLTKYFILPIFITSPTVNSFFFEWLTTSKLSTPPPAS